MKKIKIKFVDYWPNHHLKEDIIYKWISSHFEIEMSDNPDYIIYSCFGYEHLNYDCIRIFYTAENVAPNFNECDYALSFEQMKFGDRNLQLPNFMKYKRELDLISKYKYDEESNCLLQRDFCSYVVSNGKGNKIRENVYDKLSEYKFIASGGSFKNNVGGKIDDKIEFQSKYKFSIAFENSSHIGYTTEKILQAFASRTLPIYWGDPCVNKYFNPKAFINVNDFNSLEEAIDYIKKVDNDDELYLSYLREFPWVRENFDKEKLTEFDKFMGNIFFQKYTDAFRRNKSAMSLHAENRIINWQLQEKEINQSSITRRIFSKLKELMS